MIIGSVIVGRGESGEIVWTPLPGLLKLIVSVLGRLLVQMIAWRSEPMPESSVLTTSEHDCTVTAALNSDVLPSASVAVATILSFPAKGAVSVRVTVVAAPAGASKYVS